MTNRTSASPFLRTIGCAALLSMMLLPSVSWSGKPSANADGVANDGYDVVAYFTQHAAIRGSKAHSASHAGATYYFTSSDHAKMFKKDPVAYLPAYDGFCAFAIAKHNAKVKADPETFKLHDGRLLLFFNDFNKGTPVNTIVFWNGAEEELRAAAEENWKSLAAK